MSETPRLKLPYLLAAQAQKEVTHNEALNRLDMLVQAVCLEVRSDPPATPAEGDSYIVGAAASGDWAGREAAVAAFHGGWIFAAPQAGWSFHELATGRRLRFDGVAWTAAAALQVPTLGSGWTGYGGGYGGVRYHRDQQGLVTIEGLMQAGTDGSVFTLLPGYRPADNLMFCCWSAGGPYRVDVHAEGDVVAGGSDTVFSSLSGIRFQAAG